WVARGHATFQRQEVTRTAISKETFDCLNARSRSRANHGTALSRHSPSQCRTLTGIRLSRAALALEPIHPRFSDALKTSWLYLGGRDTSSTRGPPSRRCRPERCFAYR